MGENSLSPEAPKINGLAIVNPRPALLYGPSLLHELVRASSPSHLPAILSFGPDRLPSTVSYEQLHSAADTLACRISAALESCGKSPPYIVPLLVPQSPGLYVSLLAILKCGAAFCPLNLDTPLDRLKFILKDVDANVVITTDQHASMIPVDGGQSLVIVDEYGENKIEHKFRSRAADIPRKDGLAYVMYTSGSTGTPKGVGISHSAATQSLLAHDRHIPSFKRFLQFAAPTFDVSVFEIFFPLMRGSTIVSCSRSEMLNDLTGVIQTMQVDACELTPTVAASLLRYRNRVPTLKLLLTIGEMLTRPVIREFGGSNQLPSMLWAMYGPTEAAIHW
jgi:ferricrocin synthase